ncbi:MAG: spermidine/putrescine ABC transporter substrate-binding protein [Alphaproteobacteria bacterium]|nr:spermidine/putrescine ABC transporter substrate-binding protein [Alphaproteobacteria bacterium]MBU0805385.1 spermidine/putrescine ABC transporter substrate-binding protein [Alphaproteobacteria bacterium]MBU0873331.1 spermidine/putrescine ABC transporter substrate-binding protein [Alphaproteobacteria bacterium]MBU1401441.1 spermidine/putrescine ABC transporter substrate-binding protein [Alphaproteobacteria bacterium]MBU1592142.1 spermidine/putrescine ABC transporter substrate-binding protein 
MTKPKILLAASALALIIGGPAMAEDLRIFGWANEMPDQVIADFEKETGITVTFDTFDSNESMIAKLDAGATGYDLVNPSQYAVQILISRGTIAELDHAKIDTYDNIGPSFKQVSYDPGNKYSIPYVWGTTGLAYNKSCVDEPITSWKALFDEKYKGRIYMLDNMLAAYIAGLQVNGFSANTSDPAEVEKATETLIAQKPLLAGYNSTNFADLVSSGEACIVESWSSSVLQAIKDNPDVVYVLPEEGGTMWIDGYSILSDAPNPDAAYKFLTYILRPEVAAKTTELSQTATVVPASKALLPGDLANNSAVFPDEATIANADFILDLGDAMKFYQDGWTKVKAAQ